MIVTDCLMHAKRILNTNGGGLVFMAFDVNFILLLTVIQSSVSERERERATKKKLANVSLLGLVKDIRGIIWANC